MPADVALYLNLCESGRFYEFLQDLAGLSHLTRDQIKHRTYVELFFWEDKIGTEFKQAFAETFPTVMATIRQLKAKDYRHLAQMMQRREAGLVIGRAVDALRRYHPDVPVLTVHDAILTVPRHVETVRHAMLCAFETVGIKPTLKIEEPKPVRLVA